MPFERKTFGDAPAVTTPLCLHLRSKGMYVTGQPMAPEQAEEALSHSCWCNISQHVLGPDQGEVDPRQCNPGRACYQR